jgi:hypothetical protein
MENHWDWSLETYDVGSNPATVVPAAEKVGSKTLKMVVSSSCDCGFRPLSGKMIALILYRS